MDRCSIGSRHYNNIRLWFLASFDSGQLTTCCGIWMSGGLDPDFSWHSLVLPNFSWSFESSCLSQSAFRGYIFKGIVMILPKKDIFGDVLRNMAKLICILLTTQFSPVFSVVPFWLRNPSLLSPMHHSSSLAPPEQVSFIITISYFLKDFSMVSTTLWRLVSRELVLLSVVSPNVSTFPISRSPILLFSNITGKTEVQKQWRGKKL